MKTRSYLFLARVIGPYPLLGSLSVIFCILYLVAVVAPVGCEVHAGKTFHYKVDAQVGPLAENITLIEVSVVT